MEEPDYLLPLNQGIAGSFTVFHSKPARHLYPPVNGIPADAKNLRNLSLIIITVQGYFGQFGNHTICVG